MVAVWENVIEPGAFQRFVFGPRFTTGMSKSIFQAYSDVFASPHQMCEQIRRTSSSSPVGPFFDTRLANSEA